MDNRDALDSSYRSRRIRSPGILGWNRPLLEAATTGTKAALDELFPLVYEELRTVAHRRLRAERAGHTLNTTALVHEAYVKLVGLERIEYRNRAHFFAIAARAMRQILVNYAIGRRTKKRGGGFTAVSLDDAVEIAHANSDDLLALEDTLKRLETLDHRQSQVVECKFFGGMSNDETAAALGISPATVKREWATARAWLNREVGGE
jgi:RNA polymerase sigma factor (TIGR02999 family)